MGTVGPQNLHSALEPLDVYPYLESITGGGEDHRFLPVILSFIPRPEIADLLGIWASDSRHAQMLMDLSDAAKPMTVEIDQIYTPQPHVPLTKQFDGCVTDFYLCVMLAGRPWPVLNEDSTGDGRRLSNWIERLKLFVLVQSLASVESGYAREKNLSNVCRALRLCCEDIDEKRAAEFQKLATESLPFTMFVEALRYKIRTRLRDELDPVSDKNRSVLIGLMHVIDQDWVADKAASSGPSSLAPETWSRIQSIKERQVSALSGFGFQNSAASQGASQSTQRPDAAIIDDDGLGGVDKPHVAGRGAIFQQLEMTLMLPFSWNRMRPVEAARLTDLLLESLAPERKLVDRAGAAITLLAMLLARNLPAITLLKLERQTEDDWTLDLQSGHLIRRPPRVAKRWKAPAAATEEGWISPLVDSWRIKLAQSVTLALRHARKASEAGVELGEVWASISPEASLDGWFRSVVEKDPILARVSPSMIAEWWVTALHQTQDDQATLSLLTSNPRTNLSARCYYMAHTAGHVWATVESALPPAIASVTPEYRGPRVDRQNAAGSEMMVDVARIRGALEKTVRTIKYDAHDWGDWINEHNRITGLFVVALLASTGARPVNSPFERLADFDLGKRLVFISDKQGGRSHHERLGILADRLTAWLQSMYLPYLLRLAQSMSAPGETNQFFCDELLAACGARPAADDVRLPLFFFVKRREDGIEWVEIKEDTLFDALGLEWPLAPNVFRHIFSTHCSNGGLPHDIRDALMGHADRYAEPHGDFSPRIPEHDFEVARPVVNSLFDQIFPAWHPQPLTLPPESSPVRLSMPHTALFGRRLRADRRHDMRERVKKATLDELERLTEGEDLIKWSSDRWYALGSKMLTRPDGGPDSTGWLRYQVFEEFVRQKWQELGAMQRSSKAVVRLPPTRPYFTPDVVGVDTRLEALRASFTEWSSGPLRVHDAPTLAACLAALALVLEHDLASKALIKRVVFNPAALVTVRFKERYWLEWPLNDGEPWSRDRPVFRIAVSWSVVRWLGAARKAGKILRAWPAIPSAIAAWQKSLTADLQTGSTLEAVLNRLIDWREQSNNLNRNGIESAYLSQRQVSCALPHTSWVGAMVEPALALGAEREADWVAGTDIPLDELEALRSTAALHDEVFSSHLSAKEMYSMTKHLLQSIKEVLRNPSMSARERSRKVLVLLEESPLPRGHAAIELGRYGYHLLNRKKLHGAEALKQSTVQRDWYALEQGFIEMASDAVLVGMDEDELTDLYSSIVQASGPKRGSPDAYENADAQRRCAQELQRFHRFVAPILGLDDPDWSEFCASSAWINIRAGYVPIDAACTAMQLLTHGEDLATLDSASLTAAFSCLVAARFGLRIGEVVGLQRRDWVGEGQSVVVLVRANSLRTIKSKASRRVVPLVEALSEWERCLVDEVLRRWERKADGNIHRALLDEVTDKSFDAIKSTTSSRIITAIRQVTGVPSLTTHHLRHAYAMRQLDRVMGSALGSWAFINPADTDHIRRLLLVHPSLDKRALWAISRLLGHANPGVTIMSYLHQFDRWTVTVSPDTDSSHRIHGYVQIDLDRAPRITNVASSSRTARVGDQIHAPRKPSRLDLLAYLRNVSVGIVPAMAAKRSGLQPRDQQHIDSIVDHLIDRIRRQESEPCNSESRIIRRQEFLSQVSKPAWARLVKLFESMKGVVHEALLRDWHLLVNRREELIVYSASQLERLQSFIRDCGLSDDDWSFLFHPESDVNFLNEIKQRIPRARNSSEELPPRRIDRHTLEGGWVQKNRAVVVIQSETTMLTNRELTLAWGIYWASIGGESAMVS